MRAVLFLLTTITRLNRELQREIPQTYTGHLLGSSSGMQYKYRVVSGLLSFTREVAQFSHDLDAQVQSSVHRISSTYKRSLCAYAWLV